MNDEKMNKGLKIIFFSKDGSMVEGFAFITGAQK
jgi:hypothetical protein